MGSVRYAHSRISYMDDRTGNTCNGLIPTIIAKCGAFLKDEGNEICYTKRPNRYLILLFFN